MTGASNARAVEVDTRLAELYDMAWDLRITLERAYDSVHRALNEKSFYAGRGKPIKWPTSDVEAEEKLRAELPQIETVRPWRVEEISRNLSRLIDIREKLAEIAAQRWPLEEEYDRERWSRFFLVVSSAGGHIHRDMSCATCHPRTRYAWLPTLSGLTEADAVAAKGPLLCTVCFPSAPTEWTSGGGETKEPDPHTCPGSGQPPRKGSFNYCAACGRYGHMTSSGVMRKHQRPKEKGAD